MSGGSLRSLLMKRSNSMLMRDGIDLGDAERVADRGVGGRAAALAQDVVAPREGDDVVDGEEVGLVVELGDQRELVLDQLAHVGRAPGRRRTAAPSPLRPARADATPGVAPGGTSSSGILVAQLVERERAARDEIERGVGQLARIERGEPRARAQVALAVGEERVAAFGERRAQADRGQRVLQRAPGAHVHVHVARGDERQARGVGERRERREARAVAGAREELRGDPRAAGEDVGDPARVIGMGSDSIFPQPSRVTDAAPGKSSLTLAGRNPQREAARRERRDVVARERVACP